MTGTDLSRIKAFVFDVDGVLTDGGVFCDVQGELYRTFDSKDGFAIRMATMNGYPVGCITGGRSVSIRARLLTCGMVAEDIYLGSRIKEEEFADFCRRHGLTAEEVMYCGDDIPDIGVLRLAGLPACPADAVDEVRAAARYVSPLPGGRGVIRDLIERVMKAQGRWVFDPVRYQQLY